MHDVGIHDAPVVTREADLHAVEGVAKAVVDRADARHRRHRCARIGVEVSLRMLGTRTACGHDDMATAIAVEAQHVAEARGSAICAAGEHSLQLGASEAGAAQRSVGASTEGHCAHAIARHHLADIRARLHADGRLAGHPVLQREVGVVRD
jgi:hypothetical protein